LKNTSSIISTPFDLEEHDGGTEVEPVAEYRTLALLAAHHGQRLDKVLVDLVAEFSRSYLQQLIDLGAVCINGKIVRKASFKVKLGDSASIELRPTPQSQAFKAEQRSINLVYEDEHLLVINKPAGWVVHPAPGNWSGTLMNALLGYDQQAFHLPRAGIVHRLDKDTSGLMVVARSRSVMDALVRAIAAREVKRQYVALAHGAWQGAAHCEVNLPIGRDPGNRLRMAVVDLTRHPGKTARTDIDLLANCAQACLVKCTLHTGRTHQIRVHMASLKHPLLADSVYAGQAVAGLQRQALHAWRLAFVHPVSLQAMSFEAALPEDFSLVMEELSLKYNFKHS
jgi:23S rRNA pseudouridine1911/1915/1917 synthase